MNSREHQAHHTGQNFRKRGSDHFYHHKSYNHGSIKQLSKQQFIQANCQFVVIGNHGYDYSVHLRNPDLFVPWEYIEQVRFRQTGSTEIICPICLSLPNAAQITKCGHIFCFSCVLHYLAVSDDKKCPVCFGPLKKDDLKSVVSIIKPSVSVGDEINLRLMHRQKGQVITEPYDSSRNDRSELDWSDENNQANLIIVDPMIVVEQVTQKEQEELSWRHEENEESEICFIEQAMDILNQRMEKLHRMAEIHSLKSHDTLLLSKTVSDIPPPEPTKNYLFYQCSSEHVYLNPFCTKILSHEFGNLENCPREIVAKIIGLECVSMNEACRKRFKYLQHLPLSCEFRLIEIDLKHLISSKTYDHFKPQILSREKERERRLREEQKRDKIIEVQQNRKIYGIMPTLDISLDSREQFPSVSGHSYPSEVQESQIAQDSPSEGPAISNPGPGLEPVANQPQESSAMELADDLSSRPTSSFEAIQKQEEQEALTNSGNNSCANSWAAKSRSTNQSSFAKLLVDAREKKWTMSVKDEKNQTSLQQLPSNPGTVNQTHSVSETDEEQVRAPPCQFTISDFLEQNVSFSKKSRKPKKQTKKG
uniref:E3 ubiquitin-protein ligase RNF10 n=1 Tax=Aceria tosichella TaxID=561515 RepID=A0A6G1SEZ0_9ACAR